MNLTELYCDVDEFWHEFALQWYAEQLGSGERRRQRAGQLHESKIMCEAAALAGSFTLLNLAWFCPIFGSGKPLIDDRTSIGERSLIEGSFSRQMHSFDHSGLSWSKIPSVKMSPLPNFSLHYKSKWSDRQSTPCHERWPRWVAPAGSTKLANLL